MKCRDCKIFTAIVSAVLAATALVAAPENPAEAYRLMIPAVSFRCKSVSDLASAFSDSLGSMGYPVEHDKTMQAIAGAFLLPDVDFADVEKPACIYYLAHPVGVNILDCAAMIPLSRTGKAELLESLAAKYGEIAGKTIRVCRQPLDDDLPEVIYFATVEGNALVSTTLNGLRWLAANQRDKTLPVFDLSQDIQLEIAFNGPLAGRMLRQMSALDENNVADKTSPHGDSGTAKELAALVETFSGVSIELKSALDGLSIAIKLDSPRYSPFDISMRKLKTPDESLASLVPDFASNLSVSSAPGVIGSLPANVRRWLTLLSLDMWFAGFSVFPAAPELDSAFLPMLTGESVSMFIADKSTLKLGNAAFYNLSDPAASSDVLKRYFAKGGPAYSNSMIKVVGVRTVKSCNVYQYDVDFANFAFTGSSSGGTTISAAAEMTRVEVAVWNGKLLVTYGHRELADLWLDDQVYHSSSHVFAYKPLFPEPAGEDAIPLGGGFVKPVETFRRIFSYVDSLRYISDKLPHPGNGFFWAVSRVGSSAIIELRLSSNEILAFRALDDVKSTVVHGIMSKFVVDPSNIRKLGDSGKRLNLGSSSESDSADGEKK